MNPYDKTWIDEYDIRRWFSAAPLEQARDTLHVCEGVVQVRSEAQPKRKTRSDAGKPREQIHMHGDIR